MLNNSHSKISYLIVFLFWLIVYGTIYLQFEIGSDILGHYHFRQTQVGSVILGFEDNSNLIGYKHPVLGPPWMVPMEFPLYQFIVARVSDVFGSNIIETGRFINAISVLIIALTINSAGKYFKLPQLLVFFIVLFICLSPHLIYWTFALMIEVFTLMLCILGLYLSIRAIESENIFLVVLAMLIMVAASLSKVTTFIPFALALILYFTGRWLLILKNKWKSSEVEFSSFALEYTRNLASFGFITLFPATVLGWMFVGYSDAIKAQNPLTAFLVSENLKTFTFGKQSDFILSMRYLFTDFRFPGIPSLMEMFFGKFCIFFLVVGFLGWLRLRKFWVVGAFTILMFLSGPLIFKNLYEVHFYYWVANFAFLSAFIAVGWYSITTFIEDYLPENTVFKNYRWVSLVFVTILFAYSSIPFYKWYYVKAEPKNAYVKAVGQAIKDNVNEDGIVLVFGEDWNSAVQFYSDRRLIMIKGGYKAKLEPALKLLDYHDLSFSGAAICGKSRPNTNEIIRILNDQIALKEYKKDTGCDLYFGKLNSN